MVPADDGLVRLAYLLGAPPPQAGADLAELAGFVRAWLDDPRHEPGPEAADPEAADPEAEQLRRGLGALTDRQRAGVVLRHWARLPPAEVAALLDTP
jgi:DNA-directed RNA polymerase specialized sigma24 family protein